MSDRVLNLTCCCCGAGCKGRQWWNRDTGYGICRKCIEGIRKEKKHTEEEIRSYYGVEGVHFNVDESKGAA